MKNPPEPRRLLEGGDGSPSQGRLGLLLEGMRPTPPTPGLHERVWRGVPRPGQSARAAGARKLGWCVGAAAVVGAAAALALFVARSAPPASHPLTVELAAGDVRVTQPAGDREAPAVAGMVAQSGARLATGAQSRSFVRSPEFGALLTEATEAVVVSGDAPYVELHRGAVFVAVQARRGATPFAVRARGFEVRVTGTVFGVTAGEAVDVSVAEGAVEVLGGGLRWRVSAGECWSSRARAVERCAASAPLATVEALSAQGGPRARLRIDGPTGLRVRSGSVELGHPPIDWLAPAGAQHLVGSAEEGTIAADLTLTPGVERRHAFALPAGASGGGAAADSPGGVTGPGQSDAPSRPWLEAALQQNRLRVAREAQASRSSRNPAAEPIPTEDPGASVLLGSASSVEPVRAEDRVESSRTDERGRADGPAAAHADRAVDEHDAEARRYRLAKRLSRSGHHAEAVKLLREIASARGSFAEVAQYDIGWILARDLNDPAGAAEACEEYRRRHPEGRLRQEVDLNLIEALAEGGHRQRALAEAEAFLSRHPASERVRGVKLLRANLLCDLGAFEASLQAFTALGGTVDRVAEDASFYGAVCLGRAGRPDDARTWLESYRSRFPHGLHAAEVARRLAAP